MDAHFQAREIPESGLALEIKAIAGDPGEGPSLVLWVRQR